MTVEGQPERLVTVEGKGAAMERVGVVGGGTMGAGIAHVLLAAGVRVTLVEAGEEQLARAVERVSASVDAAARRGRLAGTPAEVLDRLSGSVDLAAVAGAALVIEAVPEQPALKRRVLRAVQDAAGPAAVVATNTSSLSIDELAQALRHPERFVGMHFFNPVPASALVEVVRGARTSTETLALAHRVAALAGKETIEIADAPGFATSRLGVAIGLEAIRMVEEGVGTPEAIDRAMVLGYRYPMGPLRLGDLVGLDVRLGIAEYLHERLGDRFEPPALLRRMVAEGRLGAKTGRGFYNWDRPTDSTPSHGGPQDR
jgi:3-hydroxybutyryl-CoA dehydrogenase